MTQIGRFTATADGFAGHLETLTLHMPLNLVPAEFSDAEHAPDYRVFAGEGTMRWRSAQAGSALVRRRVHSSRSRSTTRHSFNRCVQTCSRTATTAMFLFGTVRPSVTTRREHAPLSILALRLGCMRAADRLPGCCTRRAAFARADCLRHRNPCARRRASFRYSGKLDMVGHARRECWPD